jgi:hypothetical protein
LPLWDQHRHELGATFSHRQRDCFESPQADQETVMSRLLRAGAIAVAIFGGAGFGAAQTASGNDHPDLTPTQQQSVSQGLANSPAQPAPTGAQPQVGDKVPDSMTARSLPGDVTVQVPAVKKLLFVKLPDRIVLIDPDTKLVSEIVLNSDSSATGSNPR